MNEHITLVGNVASTPEHAQTPSGVSVLTFRLASNRRRFDAKSGTWVDAGTNWYTVSAYRRLADNARDSLGKGDSVVVTGRLRLREWESAGRRGMCAEVDAEALGPDLRWGTSRFTRTPRIGALRGPGDPEGPDDGGPSGEDAGREHPGGGGAGAVAAEDGKVISEAPTESHRRRELPEDAWSVLAVDAAQVPF